MLVLAVALAAQPDVQFRSHDPEEASRTCLPTPSVPPSVRAPPPLVHTRRSPAGAPQPSCAPPHGLRRPPRSSRPPRGNTPPSMKTTSDCGPSPPWQAIIGKFRAAAAHSETDTIDLVRWSRRDPQLPSRRLEPGVRSCPLSGPRTLTMFKDSTPFRRAFSVKAKMSASTIASAVSRRPYASSGTCPATKANSRHRNRPRNENQPYEVDPSQVCPLAKA